MLPVKEEKEEKDEKLNNEREIYNNLNNYYSFDNNKNECKKYICTFIKDLALIIIPIILVIGTVLLISFLA